MDPMSREVSVAVSTSVTGAITIVAKLVTCNNDCWFRDSPPSIEVLKRDGAGQPGRAEAGYETIFGDLMFGLDVPMAIHKLSNLKLLAALLMPVAGRLPFEWIYPIGEKQEKRTPKWGKYYEWATVIAGDCHYIKRFMPDTLPGKVIVTNTTTPEDGGAFTGRSAALAAFPATKPSSNADILIVLNIPDSPTDRCR